MAEIVKTIELREREIALSIPNPTKAAIHVAKTSKRGLCPQRAALEVIKVS